MTTVDSVKNSVDTVKDYGGQRYGLRWTALRNTVDSLKDYVGQP